MAADGEFNIGQLVRERHAAEGVVLVGFSSYRGTVIAGRQWEAPMERMNVPTGRSGSWESALHAASPRDKLIIFNETQQLPDWLEPRGHRAIGVVYRPEFERYGNYVPTILPRRYDALLYIDRSEALHPFGDLLPRQEAEFPETFPTGV